MSKSLFKIFGAVFSVVGAVVGAAPAKNVIRDRKSVV